MTFEDAIKANATFVNVPDNAIQLAFIKRDIEITDDFTNDKLEELELVSADLYLELATNPEWKEGDLSVKYDTKILMRRASNIYRKYDDPKLEETGSFKLDLKVTKVQ